jgi:hypothetical protein
MVIAKLGVLAQGLAYAGNATVAKYAKASSEKGAAFGVAFDVLMEEELDEGLGYSEFFGFHMGG